MTWLALSKSGGGNYNPTNLFWFVNEVPAGSFYTAYNNIGHPAGVGMYDGRVSAVNYRGRAYGFGGFTDNWMVDEFLRTWRIGMLPPDTIPVITCGAGAFVQIPYVRFRDSKTGEVSPLSGAGAPVTGDLVRSWTGLPTEEPGNLLKIAGTTTVNASTTITGVGTSFTLQRPGDKIAVSSAATTYAVIRSIASDTSMVVDRVLGNGTTQTMTVKSTGRADEIELLVSVDGSTPRVAIRRQLGPTTASESVATLALGEAAPTTFERMPRCSFGAIYHERLVAAGDILAPDTLYVSPIGFPERWENFTFKTRNGEPITALALAPGDILLVYTNVNCYSFRGWTESDLTLTLIDPEIGAFHHWAVEVIHGKPWVANQHGWFMYNGQHHLIMKDRQQEWQKDYKANRALFENGFMTQDSELYVCQYVIPNASQYSSSFDDSLKPYINSEGAATLAWTADYISVVPELAGSMGQPHWATQTYDLPLRCASNLTLPGTSQGRLMWGACDGYVRLNSDVALGDDGDSSAPYELIIMTPPAFMGDPLGDGQEGKTFTRLWSHIQIEDNTCEVEAYGGDEEAWRAAGPDNETFYWGATLPASRLTGVIGTPSVDLFYVPKTIHEDVMEQVSGRALTMIYIVANPLFVRFRGFAGEYGPGPVTRPANVGEFV